MVKSQEKDVTKQSVNARLSRLHVALMTPYDAAGNIDHDCLRRLIAFVREQGIDGFYVGGSTGEGLLQSVEERMAVFATVAEAVPESVRIGHAGALATREAKILAQSCARLGYDAISAIPPIYFPHHKQAIFGYYQDILEAANGTPLIIYNIPAMSGVTFSLDDLGRLLELPGVVGIKQTSVDLYQMEQLHHCFPDKILLNGYDEILLAGLCAGARGGIGSSYNILGSCYLGLLNKFHGGDIEAARIIQSQCNRVIDELLRVGVFPGLKYLLYRLGVIETPLCRCPLATLSGTDAERFYNTTIRLTNQMPQ